MKEYKFYGWQTADCKPADPTYEKIQNPDIFMIFFQKSGANIPD